VIKSNIHDNVKLNIPCYIQDSTIDNYTYIASNSNISNTSIGKFCSIGKNFSCGLGLHPLNGISTSPMFYSTKKQNGFSLVSRNKYDENKNITIGNDVFIGMNVTILDGVKIGNGVVVGACSFVNKYIPDYDIVGGNTARILKYRFKEDEIERLNSLSWWNWDDDKLKNVESHFFNIDIFLNSHI
jgi:acetyltransferase-like isoleucine patch superfamily enzyme